MLTRFVPRALAGAHSERGQYLVLFVVMFSLILGLGAFAIDQGVWLGERRIAQKDADISALAGAHVFLSQRFDNASEAQAEADAEAIADKNLADIDASLTTFNAEPDCNPFDGDGDGAEDDIVWQDVPSVEADINAPTGGLFSSLFGVGSLDELGSDAIACVGEPEQLEGVDPFYIAPNAAGPDVKCFFPNGTPKLGTVCPIVVPTGYQNNGSRGNLSLQDDPLNDATNCDPFAVNSCETECTEGNANNTDEQVVESSSAICLTDDGVYTKQGAFANVMGALRCRIQGYAVAGNSDCPNGSRSTTDAPGEGFCDDDFNDSGAEIPPFADELDPVFPGADVISSPGGVDDFTEAFSLPGGGAPTSLASTETLVPNVCNNGEQSPRILTIIIGKEPPGPGGVLEVDKFATFFVLGCWDLEGGTSDTFVGSIDPLCSSVNANRTAMVGIFVKAFLPTGGGVLNPCDPEDETCLGQSILLVQ